MTAIAITGPTGNFGHALIGQLEQRDDVTRIVGVARRPFDPAVHGWRRLEYRRGDVRDRATLAEAFSGADAVVHLAFAKFGHGDHDTLSAINMQGTLNAFRAAVEGGVRRFVFASSIAAYGCHADNPQPLTEDSPARGSERWFYPREKAQLEELLRSAAAEHPAIELTILRPGVVVGPQTAATIGDVVPPALRPLMRLVRRPLAALPVAAPVVAFPQPLQFVHESDVGVALVLALLGEATGTFNLAGEGTVSGEELARELGLAPLPVPASATRALASALSRLPRLPAALEMAEVATHPVLVDTARARRELGWNPRYTSLEALRAAIRHAQTPPAEETPCKV